MQTKKPMLLVLAGPNGSGKSTITNYFEKVGKYIIRKHKDDLSIYPNEYWSEQDILKLIDN